MRKLRITAGEYYHVYNRGVNKQNIFLDRRDYARLLFDILLFQSTVTIWNTSRAVSHLTRHSVLSISQRQLDKVIQGRYVELIAFALMPNHFHLIIYEKEENGISRYMQRVLNAYTKCFNTKYQKSGHLFQGPFQIVHIEDNEQLVYLSAYVHQNSRELQHWRSREDKYPWSSYQDYLYGNRWGELLRSDIIRSQFKNVEEYKKAVQQSGVKEVLDEVMIFD